jgi:hypothetical protein
MWWWWPFANLDEEPSKRAVCWLLLLGVALILAFATAQWAGLA